MKIILVAFFCIFTNPLVASAQRDPPVFDSFLASISLWKERTSLDLELTFARLGGPIKQLDYSQAYVLGYLEKDETRILELAADQKLTMKSQNDALDNAGHKLLLDFLVDEELATVLATTVTQQAKPPVLLHAKSTRPARGLGYFEFSFSFENKVLFRAARDLRNFDPERFALFDQKYYDDKLKLMVFVPVNDCRYATAIPRKLRESHDFAHFYDSDTILQYFKPLPYRFQFKPLEPQGDVLMYID